MAIYKTKAYLQIRPMALPIDALLAAVPVDVEFPATAPVNGDLILLTQLPPGTKALDYDLIFPDIDSNGSPAFAFSLGIANAGLTDLGTEVWGTGLTAGQSAAIVRNTSSAAAQGDSTTTRVLALKVTTAPATYAGAGKVGQIVLKLAG